MTEKQSRKRKQADVVSPLPSQSGDLPFSNSPTAGIITLLTDFGTADIYVGVMKGVISGINPRAGVIDLCHGIPPQDVRGAAFQLFSAFEYFPPGTIHVAVVDPTVGSQRSALCVQSGKYFFVGPDNGVLSLACYRAGRPKIYLLEEEKYFLKDRSRTFHGRDIFAPVAAHLSAGVPVESFGRKVESMERIHLPRPTSIRGKRIVGRIIYVDRFGNLITNIEMPVIRKTFPNVAQSELTVDCAGYRINGLSRTYADVASGNPLALVGSYNVIEVSVREGNASAFLKADIDERVFITAAR